MRRKLTSLGRLCRVAHHRREHLVDALAEFLLCGAQVVEQVDARLEARANGDIEDLSYEDIAAVLEISLGTVKSRILRGREALRKILEERLEVETSVHWSAQLQVD